MNATRVIAACLVLSVATAGGCAQPPGAPGRSDATAPQAESRTPKTLVFAIQQEPASFIREISPGNLTQGGGHLPIRIAHNGLVREDVSGVYRAEIAVEKPSFEKNTWRLNPDGSMEMVWRIHPNVTWHDGVPFTADDLLFSLNVLKDPETASDIGQVVSLMESTVADPYTLVMRWATPYAWVDKVTRIGPLPRHLLGDVYRTNRASLPSSAWFTTEFIGLGPYRLSAWERGSHMELTAFDGYFRGRPPVDTIIVHFILDQNTLIANILSGAVDVIPPIAIGLDSTLEVKRRWEGTGNQAVPGLRGGFRIQEIQLRPEFARPQQAMTSTRVRQALYHATNRHTLTEVMSYGVGPIADSWLTPTDALRPQLEAWIPQFPYDPARAQALLAQAGWVRGGEGVLVHQETGERFEIQLAARGAKDEREQNIVADDWKQAGVRVNHYNIPAALASNREHLSTLPGAWVGTLQIEHLITTKLHSGSIQSAANRWSGQNRSGYSNPVVDTLLDKLATTVVAADQLALYRDLLREEMGDVPVMPLYWEADILLMAKGVKGPADAGNIYAWDLMLWDKE